jgi:hypothetical protein
MRLDTYEFERRPSSGVLAPIATPRIQIDQTYGGAIAHRQSGHLSDVPCIVAFDGLDLLVKHLEVQRHTGVTGIQLLAADEAVAIRVDVGAGAFAAVSWFETRLVRAGDISGPVSVEVWDRVGAEGHPEHKVGLLGSFEASDVEVAPSFSVVDVWAEIAWPLLPLGGWIVLNAAACTGAGTLDLAGENWPGAKAVRHYTVAAGWHALNDKMANSWVYQGSQPLVLRGMAAAYCHPGGESSQVRTLVLDDSREFSVVAESFTYETEIHPWGTSAASWSGLTGQCQLALAVLTEVGQQELAT